MTLRRALGVAANDLYHQAWRLMVLNVLLGAVVLVVVFATLAVRSAIILAVLIGPVLAAVMHCVVTLSQTEDLRLVELQNGLRRHWRHGIVLGAALAIGGHHYGAHHPVACQFDAFRLAGRHSGGGRESEHGSRFAGRGSNAANPPVSASKASQPRCRTVTEVK